IIALCVPLHEKLAALLVQFTTRSNEVLLSCITAKLSAIKHRKDETIIRDIASIVDVKRSYSRIISLLTTFNSTSLKMAGRLTLAVIAALLWVNLPAAMLSAPSPFIIMSTKAY